ncbi:hypothetical protein [Sphingomonas profundi]|uniref:hypothetical protein n=1 Tax=Alterirhizorhabdus profundi TaxID=2681549 RepID=UPI001E2E7509|nr:hypothetical protein [Sphingomonas profundi]
MSSTLSIGAAIPARQTRNLIKATSARLTGKPRGRDRKVRRHSFDVDDPRAQVFRPIGDGSKAGAMRWIDALIRTAKEFDVVHRKPGTRGPLTPYGIRVLEELLRLPDFRTGRLDPAIAHLQKVTRFARATIVRALARLKAHGFLDWVRRSRTTGNDREAGPQRAQTSNAYFFDIGRMALNVRRRFLDLLRRREAAVQARATPQAPPPSPIEAGPRDPALAAALARLGAAVERASS